MRYSELASVQQNYLLEMGALWMDSLMGSDPEQPARAIAGSPARSGRKAHITSFSNSRTS